MAAITTQECFTDDWTRTNPDLVVYLPKEPSYHYEAVDHFLVDHTPGGDLLVIFTQAATPQAGDYRVVHARSRDGGVNWTAITPIAETGPKPGQRSAFGFPVISASGRIYCFYNKATGVDEGGTDTFKAFIRCKYSDDDGYTWVEGGVEIPYRPSKYDHPEAAKIGTSALMWKKPIRDAKGRHIVGLSRFTSKMVRQPLDASHLGTVPGLRKDFNDLRCEFVRFDNIDEGPHPKDVELTWLQNDDTMIEVPCTFEPHASQGYKWCMEPAPTLLPDGRLLTVLRTTNGQVWYTVSEDDGATWRETEVLRFRDGGDPVLNPSVPCPIYRLQDGRYLLFFQNHDGWGYGSRGPLDQDSRRPQFFALGEYREGAHQPIWFSEPYLFADTQMVGVPPHYKGWLSMYASLTDRDGQRIFWYTDRKMFGLGRYITDDVLAGLSVPS